MYRTACWVATREQRVVVPEGPLALTLCFCPPTKRRYDRDNLVARMKAGLDGVAEALGIDDQLFVVLAVKMGPVVANGAVMIQIKGDEHGY